MSIRIITVLGYYLYLVLWLQKVNEKRCWEWTENDDGSLHWSSDETLCWDWWMILTSEPTWPLSPFSPGGPGIPYKFTHNTRLTLIISHHEEIHLQIWNQGEWIACNPSGPGKPLNPLCPSSPLAPIMPCWPRGPGSPSTPYSIHRSAMSTMDYYKPTSSTIGGFYIFHSNLL